jgi:CcmD family protein
MGPWGFVALAYGIVWGAIAVYCYLLKQRYRSAEIELARLDATQENRNNG